MTKLTLVLLPGMDGTGELFEAFINALNGKFHIRVVTYPVNKALGYAQLENIAQTFLPEHEPYVILGESFSGPIAVSLAASGDANLQGLILCCTFVKNPRPAFSKLQGLINFLPIKFAPVTALSHLLLGRFSTIELRQKLAQSLKKVSPNALRTRLSGVLSVDMSEQLASIQVPVLYLRAAHDRLVPAIASVLIAKILSKMQIVELSAPHFLLQTKPVEAAELVNEFVAAIELT